MSGRRRYTPWAVGTVLIVAGLFLVLVAALPGVTPEKHPHPIRLEMVTTTSTTSSTTTTTIAVVAAPPVTHAPAPRASRSRPPVAGGDVFDALADCESHRNPTAVSKNGRYFGAFQFLLTTWQSLGMTGNPIDYPYETQKDAARRLVARSGWGQFPVCGRRVA